ncbi:MAG TPA: TetR family transcriptional regulator [Kiritimatiellia bacterium]|nr:TetR family transcriptional regulator [Kiritimatiellia bacterium]HRZ12323.1 TetR family transcriptional regulator [Kiritimatiellia bacterium]HSA17919.1 TetR family transcriptional regulator [Kiritimatiellia bacterium]
MARRDSPHGARILEAAIRVFAERGLKGATIRGVGRAAGVNSALLYYYFADKNALFVEAVSRVLERFLAHLKERRRTFRGAAERLRYLVDGIFDYYTRHPERMDLMWLAVSRHPEEFGRALRRLVAGHELVPLEVLAEGMRRGELRRMHPVEAWWSILAMCLFSLKVQTVVRHMGPVPIRRPSAGPAERKEQILGLLLHGVVEKRGGRSPAGRNRGA